MTAPKKICNILQLCQNHHYVWPGLETSKRERRGLRTGQNKTKYQKVQKNHDHDDDDDDGDDDETVKDAKCIPGESKFTSDQIVQFLALRASIMHACNKWP